MSKVTNFLLEIGGEFLAELFSLSQIKKIVSQSMAGRANKSGETKSETDIKWSGLFTLEDEKAFFMIFAKMERSDATKNVAAKITAFMNELDEAQRRRFRVVVGMLANEDFAKIIERTPMSSPKSAAKKLGEKGDETTEEKPREKTKEYKFNLGSEFLVWFAGLTPFEQMDFCKAAGILDGTLDLMERSVVEAIKNGKKVVAWLEDWATKHEAKIAEHFIPKTGENEKPNLGNRAKNFRSWAQGFRDRQIR
ncbi:MAG: hypothetical protein WC924_05960 [Candidatus Gracilibacteria bacterium]